MRQAIFTLAILLVIGSCGKTHDDKKNTKCLRLDVLQVSEVAPAGIRTVFRARTCDDAPIPDLQAEELTILLDGQGIQTEGNVAPVLNQEVDFELNTLLLLDMSNSIVDNGNLPPMISSARVLVHTLIEQGHNVAIYQFAGPLYFGAVQTYTADIEALDLALDTLAASNGMGTTDLYGAVIKAVNNLDWIQNPDILSASSLVLFTDGTDEAMATPKQQALNAVANTDSYVFTVGLGGDVNKNELLAFGKDGFLWAEDSSTLQDVFIDVTRMIKDVAKSYYVLGICSPRVGGARNITIQISKNNETGAFTVEYDANDFDIVGCDPSNVADPCQDRDCGELDGFMCGTCGTGTFCNDDGMCEDPCVNTECGDIMGLDCGDCADNGDTWACDNNSCIDACASLECGENLGVDCGNCEAFGDGFGCIEGSCEYVCEDVECGYEMDVYCGGCSGGLICDLSNSCVPPTLDGLEWANVPGGEFTLGCHYGLDTSCDSDEQRQPVTLSEFWISETEITVSMYSSCASGGGCDTIHVETGDNCNFGLSYADDKPINCISWQGLREFCQWIGGDLPTEAQWERAFRGDHDSELASYWMYPWGIAPDASCSLVVMNDGGPGCGTGSSANVMSLASTSFGLHDMAGNVAEWVLDWYGNELGDCDSPGCSDPDGPPTGSDRVVRGGAWDDFYSSSFRTAKRNKEDPSLMAATIGGRCVFQ